VKSGLHVPVIPDRGGILVRSSSSATEWTQGITSSFREVILGDALISLAGFHGNRDSSLLRAPLHNVEFALAGRGERSRSTI